MHTHPNSPRLLSAAGWRCALALWLCACAGTLEVRAEVPSFFRMARRQSVNPVATLPVAPPPAELPPPQTPGAPSLPDPTDRPPVAAAPTEAPSDGLQYLGSGYVWFDDNGPPPPTAGTPGHCWPAGKCIPSACWTLEVDAVFLNRSRGDSQTLLDDGTDDVLNATGLDFDAETGARLALSHRWNARNRVEAAWIGISDWRAGGTAAGVLNVTLPTGGTVAATDATLGYASRFHSVEVNFRQQWTNWFEALAGARWMALDDELSATGSAGTFYTLDVRNRLYGLQLGGRGTVLDHGGRFMADISAKAGLFGNAAKGVATVPSAGATLTDHDSQASLLVDVDIRGRWQFRPRAELHIGYQVLWLDELLLAAEQFDLGAMQADGHLFMHGPHIGFELRR